MDISIYGMRSKDDSTYQKHLKVMLACEEAGIEKLPKETADYFGQDWPDRYVAEEPLTEGIDLKMTEERGDGYHYQEIKVSDIPDDVDVIRIHKGW